MGLSSSQARLLNLTGRMHQIEYKAAKLEAQKLQMANESARVYQDYQDALEKTKIQLKTLNTDGSATYKDINAYTDLTNAGIAIVYNGTIYDGGTGKGWSDLITAYNNNTKSTVSTTFSETILTNLINSGDVTLVQKDANGTFPTSTTAANFADNQTSVATNTSLQEVTDESELRKAEAKYEADMKRIDNKDKKFDYDLAALDNERNAIKQEMETLKTVAKDNVERTFKLFS